MRRHCPFPAKHTRPGRGCQRGNTCGAFAGPALGRRQSPEGHHL